ncbi:RnfH family protein [Pseudomonas sp. MM211]|uniref:RnfH family protein n=1 Tax=Pseudomonas sp. MM211 TaxID=2866808 RepID=UPI001CEC1788|nr:RnfH family protein [Pseudomonas sp. MM211]UCJ16809.1 RnfH family protein [Pseudomonas sp. MM211]
MGSERVSVEVVFAAPDRQFLLALQLPAGSTVRQAALQSGLQEHIADLDLAGAPLGIFGKAVASPETRLLEEGDRVEIYRPLLADPKDVRKRRAAQAVERARLAGDSSRR